MEPLTERMRMQDFPPDLYDKITTRIGRYSVGLSAIDLDRSGNEISTQSGSGSLVRAGNKLCIFTADHVIDTIAHKPRVSLLFDWSGGYRRCAFETAHLNFVRLPRGSTPSSGPDLAAILLPNVGAGIESLLSEKVFFNIDKRIAAFKDKAYPDIRKGFWFPCGVIAQGAQPLPAHRGFAKVEGHWALCGIAGQPRETVHEGYDYLELTGRLDAPDMPSKFNGLSGGGLWQVEIRKGIDGTLYDQEITLSGVIFVQGDVENGERTLKCHGRASVYEKLAAAVANSQHVD